MKKILKIGFIIFSILLIILFIDFINANYNETKPIFSIKKNFKNEQLEVYYGLFFKTYRCVAEDDTYITKSYFYKYQTNICPKEYNINFDDGYITTNTGINLSENEFNQLIKQNSVSEIMNMNEDEIDNALNTDYYIPIRAIPYDYTLNDAINDQYFVSSEKIYNIEKYNEFMDKIINNENAFLRIINTTMEGHLIIIDIFYEDNSFKIITDYTRDKYSPIKSQNYTEYIFKSIIEHNNILYAYNDNYTDSSALQLTKIIN